MARLPDGYVFTLTGKKGAAVNIKKRELVCCKSCKHFKSVMCPLSMVNGDYLPAHNPDFYCADGERRAEDDEA